MLVRTPFTGSAAVALLLSTLLLAGCGSGDGPAKPALSDSACRFGTTAEMERIVGFRLRPDPFRSAHKPCDWQGDEDWSTVYITTASAEYHNRNLGSANLRELSGIGEDAYVSHGMLKEDDTNWRASAAVGDVNVVVLVAGPKASEEATVALLRHVVSRL